MRFEKKPWKWDDRAHYGQGNRTWLVKGPFNVDDPQTTSIDPQSFAPKPGRDGWSDAVYFSDDKIDLRLYFNRAVNCVAYAYAEFTAPRTQEAELWVGSDESLDVWINGEEVYQFNGARWHKLPNDKTKVRISTGRNTLLVKAYQTSGRYDFSVNICEVESDERYSGNRIAGLRFSLPRETSSEDTLVNVRPSADEQEEEWYQESYFRLAHPNMMELEEFLPVEEY